MKWFIASDIHGSAHYCKEMLNRFKIENADRLLLLGDILYHGPRNELPYKYAPKEVISLLNDEKHSIVCVRGNCDTEVDQMVLEFPVLADYTYICDNDLCIFATHGHKYNEKTLPPLKKGDILLHGHTHIPVCNVYDDFVCINPGSVSIPKEQSWHGYMIYQQGIFIWKDLEGNVKKIFSVK